jgi:hypothetical protein
MDQFLHLKIHLSLTEMAKYFISEQLPPNKLSPSPFFAFS